MKDYIGERLKARGLWRWTINHPPDDLTARSELGGELGLALVEALRERLKEEKGAKDGT